MNVLFRRRDPAHLQVFGAAADSERLRAMLSGRLGGGRSCGWPAAKLFASRDEIRVQTPFRNYRWRQADHPLIVRAIIMGWEIGDPNAGQDGYMMFGVLHCKVRMVERKLEELGYDVRSRGSR